MEEAGELVRAYRRWTCRARQPGSLEELAEELADLLIVTAVFSVRLDIDLDAAVEAKLKVVYSRTHPEGEGT